MVLGALKMPLELAPIVADQVRDIKAQHGLHGAAELKWGKVSPRWVAVYEDLIDYFFVDQALGFRGVVAHKVDLDHARFAQTHDDWYYKMYYQLLSNLLESQH